MCRDLEIGEEAIDCTETFRMEAEGLYYCNRLIHTMSEILRYRQFRSGANREVTIQ